MSSSLLSSKVMMVELHGGTLRIRSEQSIGTIVLVRLPAADRTGPETAAGPVPAAPGGRRRPARLVPA